MYADCQKPEDIPSPWTYRRNTYTKKEWNDDQFNLIPSILIGLLQLCVHQVHEACDDVKFVETSQEIFK